MDPVSWLDSVAEGSPAALLFVVMCGLFLDSLAIVGMLLPGDLLLMIPSAALGAPRALIVVVGGVTGTVLGYNVSYTVGHRVGPAIQGSWLGRRVGPRRWTQAERILRGPAGRALLLVQFMPVLNYLVPLLAGTLRVPRTRFVRLTTIGAVLYSGFYVCLGVLAGGAGATLGQSTGRLVGLLVVVVTMTGLGLTVLTGAVRRMAEERQDSPSGAEPEPPPGGWTSEHAPWHTEHRAQSPLFLREPDSGTRDGVTHNADHHDAPESTDPGRCCCRGT